MARIYPNTDAETKENRKCSVLRMNPNIIFFSAVLVITAYCLIAVIVDRYNLQKKEDKETERLRLEVLKTEYGRKLILGEDA